MATNGNLQDIELSYVFNEKLKKEKQIGFIILSSDQTLPLEMREIIDVPNVVIYEAKQDVVAVPKLLTKEILAQQREHIAGSAALINSRRASDVVAYGCTSGAMGVGSDVIAEMIHTVLPNAKVTDPLLAAVVALKTLNCKRIAFISPYPKGVNENMVEAFRGYGFEVPVAGRFHQEGVNPTYAGPLISPESIAEAVMNVGSNPEVEAVFVSCTQMRFAALVDETEKKLGKPIITSNLALCWHALRLAGCHDSINGRGRLFRIDFTEGGING